MVAVDTEGRMYSWGGNEFGQLGHGMNMLRLATPRLVERFMYPDLVAFVRCGRYFTAVLTKSNKVFLWGAGGESIPSEKKFFSDPELLPRVIAAGSNHVIVVTRDSKVFAWGSNNQGQLGLGETALDERGFTSDPQLIEDLEGKRINQIAVGTNHTIALSAQPKLLICPAFPDFNGPLNSRLSGFEATCGANDETCADKSCCSDGTSCTQFADGKWGCCAGTGMKMCEDQLTCCKADATCNSVFGTCEYPISLVQATEVLELVGTGELVPAELPSTTSKSATQEESPIEHHYTQATVLGDVHDPNFEKSLVGKASEAAYQRSGLAAAFKAAEKEYHAYAGQIAAKEHSVAPASANSQAGSHSANVAGMRGEQSSAPEAVFAPSGVENHQEPAVEVEPMPSPEDVAKAEFMNAEKEAILKLQSANTDKVTGFKSEAPQDTKPKTKMVDPETGEVISLPGHIEEKPKVAVSIEDLSDEDEEPKPKPVTVVSVDPTQTDHYKSYVRETEKSAGAIPGPTFSKFLGTQGKPQPQPARPSTSTQRPTTNRGMPVAALIPDDEGAEPEVPGAADLPPASVVASRSPTELQELLKDSYVQSHQATVEGPKRANRPGAGPCPRGAGNLDCNRDCAEVDAKVIDAARTVSDLADQVADRIHAAGESTEHKPDAPGITPSVSPSPSASSIYESMTSVDHQSGKTTIRETLPNRLSATIFVHHQDVFIPEAGIYFDKRTNQTYRISGDKVVLSNPGARFASMGSKPGSSFHGHCGVSRPTCPDNSCCEEGETCCQQQDGAFGCCPFSEGTCCLDQRHCCPGSYSCNLRELECVSENSTIAMARYQKVNQGLCDSGFRACKDGSCCGAGGSCCQMYDGLQGCAPFPEATCCSDGQHACPEGSTCDSVAKKCVDITTGMISAIGVLERSSVPPGVELVCYPEELTCESGSCCGSESTCCEDEKGYENCCPLVDGVCCGHGLCCPSSYTCDWSGSQCVGSEGVTPMVSVQPGREPSIVADACSPQESSCPGTHECCPKGSGCCLALDIVNNETISAQHCCPYGEDAVCCDDGSCCPFKHSCAVDVCISPAGERVEKVKTASARKSENKQTSTCISSKSLHDQTHKSLEAAAKLKEEAGVKLLIAQEPTLMCPPYCGNDGSAVPVPDSGAWATGRKNDEILDSPGEHGIILPESNQETDALVVERNKLEILDESENLKRSLAHLLSNQDQLQTFSARGAFAIECEYTDDFKDTHSEAIKTAISSTLQVTPTQIVLRSVRAISTDQIHGVLIELTIDPIPSSKILAKELSVALSKAMLSGSLVTALVDSGLTCANSLKVTEPPGVEEEAPPNIQDKLAILEKIQALVKYESERTPRPRLDGSDVYEISEGVANLESLTDSLRKLKHKLGTDALDTLATTTDAVERLERLAALLESLLGESDTNKHVATYDMAQKELAGIFDKIKAAREHARCQRLSPSEAAGTGCEFTHMSLASMPLRDLDDEKYDPVIQKKFGIAFLAPSGTANEDQVDPPRAYDTPHEDNSEKKNTAGEFWMPEAPHDAAEYNEKKN
eukprot:c20845_g1_i1.p1 GENE.c20845_g1_i1~~c20845_g1_i1.p1  ORF type:complete len:1791 (-),score=261.17 c20845_g1_i1:45-4703(-)